MLNEGTTRYHSVETGQAYDSRYGRLRGRKGQERRKRIWSCHPFCAMCGKLVVLTYPAPCASELGIGTRSGRPPASCPLRRASFLPNPAPH